MIKLWRDKPPLDSKKADTGYENIFPSARQALTAAIRQVGLGRKSRFALPEWSSHCVISAVGKIATPIPMKEVMKYSIPVSGILFYEQWGWPYLHNIIAAAREKFSDSILILDCIDSADAKNYVLSNDAYPSYIVLSSLSKLLGLKGGGLVKIDGEYLSFEASQSGKKLSDLLWKDKENSFCYEECLDLHKSYVQYLHPDLYVWLKEFDLETALEQEACKRRQNLRTILNSSLSSNWPEWMFNVFENGAAPGIAPLLKDFPSGKLQECQAFLGERHQIETTVYHFNWSGNPFVTEYEQCLAFPIHGLVTNAEEIITDLARRNYEPDFL